MVIVYPCNLHLKGVDKKGKALVGDSVTEKCQTITFAQKGKGFPPCSNVQAEVRVPWGEPKNPMAWSDSRKGLSQQIQGT